MTVEYVPQSLSVFSEGESIGRIVVEDIDSVYYEDDSGNIYTKGTMREIVSKLEEIEKEVN